MEPIPDDILKQFNTVLNRQNSPVFINFNLKKEGRARGSLGNHLL